MYNLVENSLPHAPEAEKVILGAILLNNNLIAEAVNSITNDDFYSPLHRKVFQAMSELYQKSQPINPIMIGEVLKRDNQLDHIGGVATITNLSNGVLHFSSLKQFIALIKEKSKTRELIRTCNETISQAIGNEQPFDDLLDKTEQTIFNLRQKEIDNITPLHTAVEKSFADLKIRMRQDYKSSLLKTGFTDLDNKLIGIGETELVIVGGRPSQGKTTLALNIARNMTSDYGSVVLFFSLEMSEKQLTSKLICSHARIDYQNYRNGLLQQIEIEQLQKSSNEIVHHKIIIDDSASLSPLQIKARARRVKQQNRRLDAIFIDYLQMMKGNGKFNSRENEVAQISKDLKAIAKELKIPIIAVCSLNRGPEGRADKRPTMADLRESGQIESDADKIMFVHRPEMYAKTEAEKLEYLGQSEVIIAKNREGETGFVKLSFDGKTSNFNNYYE